MDWYLLIHQLPPRPIYLRAKIGRRLQKAGAVALKNSVYLLPQREECLEDLQWIAQEAIDGGGEAFICAAEFIGAEAQKGLVARFNAERAADYEALRAQICAATAAERRATIERWRKRFEEIGAIDFFAARGREETERLLRSLTRPEKSKEDRKSAGRRRAGLVGRTWVTRRDPHVDRLGSAWLIRRFVDPHAVFRFVDPRRPGLKPDEIGFDMVGGEFTHEGDRCTFEVLCARLGLRNPALKRIAEIVHDLDLKDEKFRNTATDGVGRMIEGLVRRHAKDAVRVEQALALFDDLHAAFGQL